MVQIKSGKRETGKSSWCNLHRKRSISPDVSVSGGPKSTDISVRNDTQAPDILDLGSINLSDQFVLTYLAGDIFPMNAGGLPPGTADLGLGFRLGFLQLQHLTALFLGAVGV